MAPKWVFYRPKSGKTAAGWRGQVRLGGKRLFSPRFNFESDAVQWVKNQFSKSKELVKVMRRLPRKTPVVSVPLRIRTKSACGPLVARPLVRQDELQGELAQLLESKRRDQARIQELEDRNDWFVSVYRSRSNVPPTLIRRCRSDRE